jgi:hypothetical protein
LQIWSKVWAGVEAGLYGSSVFTDLGKRVVAAVAGGMSRAEAGAHYQVSHSSATRWTKRNAETGSPAARPMGGQKPFTLIIALLRQ